MVDITNLIKIINGKSLAESTVKLDRELTEEMICGAAVAVSTTVSKNGCGIYTASFRNLTDAQLWLEVRFYADTDGSLIPEKYWD